MFGITFARRYPKAQIYALDWKNVLELAEENAEKAGVRERFHKIPGSAFDVELGTDYDVALSRTSCITSIRKSALNF